MTLSRRDFLRASGVVALGAYAVACSKGGPSTPGSLDQLVGGATPGAQLITAGTELLSVRSERFAFALIDPATNQPIADLSPSLWYSTGKTKPIVGPFDAVYHGDGLGARGVYATRITFPTDGSYIAGAEFTRNGARVLSSFEQFQVGRTNAMPIIGGRAPRAPTPTIADALGVNPICTQHPTPCSMHDISLDKALANGKPTIVIIATPQFCESQLCGPEVEMLDAARPAAAGKVNFIHIEVYRDDKATTIQRQIISPAAAAWKLEQEPVIYAIGADGVIVDRTLGPVDRADITAIVSALAS